jgi:hypothetical protein
MGVGSVGPYLRPYEECDTYLSVDAGLTWTMIAIGAHKYEIGNQGGILVAVNDDEEVDTMWYSLNMGKNWYVLNDLVVFLSSVQATSEF